MTSTQDEPTAAPADAPEEDPEELLDAVEHEMREQSAIDEYDEPPAVKVQRRDGARDALEAETGREPEGGINPS